MKKLVLTLFATIGLITLSFSQYVDQALIFSQHNFGSTARSQAMGGAFGALPSLGRFRAGLGGDRPYTASGVGSKDGKTEAYQGC